MFRFRIDRIFLVAIALLALTATVHIVLGIRGIIFQTADLPGPIFLLTGLFSVGIGALLLQDMDIRPVLYIFGAGLMSFQLFAYLDWHTVQLVAGVLDAAPNQILAQDERHRNFMWSWELLSVEGLAVHSAIAEIGIQLVSAPLELVTKSAETILIALFLLLRWAELNEHETIHWTVRRSDIKAVIVLLLGGGFAWGVLVIGGNVFLEIGTDERVLDIFELSLLMVVIAGLFWKLLGKPVIETTNRTQGVSAFDWIPGFEKGMWIDNIAVAVVYGVAFITVTGLFVAGVPAGEIGDVHDHSSPELEEFAFAVEAEGIHVDHDWTMIHYSDFHGGDAVLFDYFTEYENESDGLKTEIEIITNRYIEFVDDGDFQDVQIFFGEARTQDDEAYLYWEMEQDWVESYLSGDWSREELLDEIFSTMEFLDEREYLSTSPA